MSNIFLKKNSDIYKNFSARHPLKHLGWKRKWLICIYIFFSVEKLNEFKKSWPLV